MQHYYKTGQKLEISNYKESQKRLFIRYLEKIDKKHFAAPEIKIQHQAMWFTKGIPGAKNLRKKISQEKNITKIIEEVRKF